MNEYTSMQSTEHDTSKHSTERLASSTGSCNLPQGGRQNVGNTFRYSENIRKNGKYY